MDVGWIGGGGRTVEVVRRLLGAGHRVAFWEANACLSKALEDAGACLANNVAELVQQCEVLVLGLADATQTSTLLNDPAGLPKAFIAGKLVIDLSMGSPKESLAMERQLAQHKVEWIDAAVLSPLAADEGPPTVLYAGSLVACERAMRLLQTFKFELVHCGGRPGDAQAVRLIAVAMTMAAVVATLQAVAAGIKMGLGLPSLTRVLNNGSGRSYVSTVVLPTLVEGRAGLDTTVSQLADDMDRLDVMALDCGAPIPLFSVARSMLQVTRNMRGAAAIVKDVVDLVGTMSAARLLESTSAPVAADTSPAKGWGSTIGYVGVGTMGSAVVRRLLPAHRVYLFDARPDISLQLCSNGAMVAASLQSLARDCKVVMLCLPSSHHVRAVLFGAGGMVSALSPGQIIVDQTTGDPMETLNLAGKLRRLGVELVDAPIGGGPDAVADGSAAFFCGGAPDAFQRVLPLLRSVTDQVIYCGSAGSGHTAKLVNNTASICNRMISYEAAALGRRQGLTLEALGDGLNRSTAWSSASSRIFKALATQGHTATISLDMSLKDIWSGVQMAARCGAPMPLADTVRSLIQAAVHAFGGQSNVDEAARLYGQLAGVDFACPSAPVDRST